MDAIHEQEPRGPVTLSRFSDDALPAVYRWQVLAHLRTIWPEDFTGERRFATTIHPPGWSVTHLVLAAGEVLVAYAAVVRCEASHAGEVYRVAGLGPVFTIPAFQGEGYGGRAVAAATELIDHGDADVAALWCPPSLMGFYARFGWEAMPGAITLIGPGNDVEPDPEPRLMRFLSVRGRAARTAFTAVPWHLDRRW